MRVSFSRLVQGLRSCMDVTVSQAGGDVEISGIELFPAGYAPGQTVLDGDKVYLCDLRELKALDAREDLPPLIVMIRPHENVDPLLFRSRTAAAVTGQTRERVLQTAANLLYQYGSETSRLNELTGALLKCHGLDALLETGYLHLGNPMIVTDARERIVACTDPNIVSSASFRALAGRSRMPTEWPVRHPGEQVSPEMILRPALDSEDITLPGSLCRILTARGVFVGCLYLIPVNHPWTEEDARFLDLLGNMAGMELWTSPGEHAVEAETPEETLLRDILDGTAGDANDILLRRQQLNLHLQPHLRAVVVLYRDINTGVQTPLQDLTVQLTRVLSPMAIGTMYRNSAFLLIHSPEEIRDPAAALAPLKQIIEDYQLVLGVSHEFSRLDLLPRYGDQARCALRLGQRLCGEDSLFLYRDYAVYHMLELCLRREDLSSFCAPELLRLRDSQSDADLFETLRVYLKCGQNKALTARTMYTHVNTIKYRMGLIQEILGLDLNEGNNALTLMLSYLMLDYQQAFPQETEEAQF